MADKKMTDDELRGAITVAVGAKPGAAVFNTVHRTEHHAVAVWLQRDGFDPHGSVAVYDHEDPNAVADATSRALAAMLDAFTPKPQAPSEPA